MFNLEDIVNKVHCADCLSFMREMPDGCVDMVITSPPYNCRKPYGSVADEWAWCDYYAWMDQLLNEFYRLLMVGGTLAINVPAVIRWQADHKYADSWMDYDPLYKTHRNGLKVIGKGRIEPIGFNLFDMMKGKDRHLREPITWVKGGQDSAIASDYRMGCDSDPYMRPTNELILLGSKDRWYHRGGTGRRGGDAVPFLEETKDTWFISPERNDKHPAVFPVEIPRRLINLFTHAADAVICDPFLGSGSTAMAAREANRAFIGIEISETYCEIARKRIAQAREQQDLFRRETVKQGELI